MNHNVFFLCLREPTKKKKKKKKLKKWGGSSRPSRPTCDGLELLDQAAERSDVGAVHQHWKVGEGLDQVIVHCVAAAGESEHAIADRRGAKHKLARMERDAVRAGKIRSPRRHLRPKNIFGDQITGRSGQFGD